MESVRINQVPSSTDWELPDFNPDVGWLQNMFEGKSHAEVQHYFANNFSERLHELLYSARPVFQYYIQSAALFVMTEHADICEAANSASSFLSFLLAREERDPGSVRAIYPAVLPCIEFIATHQERFDAPIEIFGDFSETAERIKVACGA